MERELRVEKGKKKRIEVRKEKDTKIDSESLLTM